MPTIDVKDAAGVTRTINTPNSDGRADAASSRSVALSNEDKAVLDSLNTKAPALVSGRTPTVDAAYDPTFGKMLVGTARDKFRDEFFSFDTTNNWELIQTGAGQTITVAGATGGARYLNIATGTTINSETILLSRSTFKLPIKLAVGLTMSQRIANQEVYVEAVSVDGSGAVETDATFPSTNLNNATNAASILFDGTLAPNFKYITRGYGISDLTSASVAFSISTVATGTKPNFLPASVFEINADMEEVVFSARNIDSIGAILGLQKRTQNLPDPAKDYKIRIRVRNLASAPASSTDVRLHFVRMLDTTRFSVDFSRYMGRTTDVADSLPVAVSNSPAVTISSGTVTTVTTVTGVTSANLGIPSLGVEAVSGAITSSANLLGTTPSAGCSYVVNIPVTEVSGTNPTLDIDVQESDDTATNWQTVYSFPRITATGIYRSPKLQFSGNRFRYVQTVGGSTPSFTRAINRLLSNDSVDMIRQLIDRTVVLTTLNSTTPGLNIPNCRNVQLVVNVGAVTTTAPALQLEGSDDNGATWYALGTPLTAVASGTVQVTVNNVQAQQLRARVSTAGVGVTAGYVLMKGF